MIALRPCEKENIDYIVKLRNRALKEDFLRHGISEEDAIHYFNEHFQQKYAFLITYDSSLIGSISIKENDEELFLENFYLEDAYQQRGIGSQVLNTVIKRSTDSKKNLSLYIFKGSQSKPFYTKFGFDIVHEEERVYKLMRKNE